MRDDVAIGRAIKSKNMPYQQLADELHKPIIIKVTKYIPLLEI